MYKMATFELRGTCHTTQVNLTWLKISSKHPSFYVRTPPVTRYCELCHHLLCTTEEALLSDFSILNKADGFSFGSSALGTQVQITF